MSKNKATRGKAVPEVITEVPEEVVVSVTTNEVVEETLEEVATEEQVEDNTPESTEETEEVDSVDAVSDEEEEVLTEDEIVDPFNEEVDLTAKVEEAVTEATKDNSGDFVQAAIDQGALTRLNRM